MQKRKKRYKLEYHFLKRKAGFRPAFLLIRIIIQYVNPTMEMQGSHRWRSPADRNDQARKMSDAKPHAVT